MFLSLIRDCIVDNSLRIRKKEEKKMVYSVLHFGCLSSYKWGFTGIRMIADKM